MIDKYLLEDLSLRSDEKGELARWVIQLQADVDTERRKSASLESVIYARDTRIAELEAQVKVWESAATKHLARAEEAEKRLATPIKIVNYDEFFICHVSGASDDYCKGWVDGRNAAARDVGKAGLTVEDK